VNERDVLSIVSQSLKAPRTELPFASISGFGTSADKVEAALIEEV